MPIVFDAQFWSGLWKIMVADLILAGDNAVVIALAVRSLDPRLQLWGRLIGAFGAVALRVLFVWIVSWLLTIPYLQLVGGILLIWIAWKLVSEQGHGEEAEVKSAGSLWHAVWIIMLADVVMSFDNVVAISAASLDANGHSRFDLVMIGLVLSIPLVIFGSGILSVLMKRLPLLVWLGAGLLGHVAGHMMLEDDSAHRAFSAAAHNAAMTWMPMTLFVLLTAAGFIFARKAASGAKDAGSVAS